MTDVISGFIIQNIQPFKFALVAITGVLLEGIILQKGDGWAKIRLTGNQFGTKNKATIAYLFEVLAIAFMTNYLAGSVIETGLNAYPILMIAGFAVAFLIKFNLQVWKRS